LLGSRNYLRSWHNLQQLLRWFRLPLVSVRNLRLYVRSACAVTRQFNMYPITSQISQELKDESSKDRHSGVPSGSPSEQPISTPSLALHAFVDNHELKTAVGIYIQGQDAWAESECTGLHATSGASISKHTRHISGQENQLQDLFCGVGRE
jgi:hypothetical protein